MENQTNQQILNDLLAAKFSMEKAIKKGSRDELLKRAPIDESTKKAFTEQALQRTSKSVRKAETMKALPKIKTAQLRGRFTGYNTLEKFTHLKSGNPHAVQDALSSLMKPRLAAPSACPRCGGKIKPDKAFCGSCGAQLRTT